MKKSAYLILVALTVLVSACKKNEEEKVLSFEKTDILFTYEEGETSIKAETSSELSDATSDADWCTVTAKKDVLAIKVTENVAKEPRSASVTVKNGNGLSQKLSVVQNGAKFIFDASDIEIPAAGGSITASYYAQDKGVVVVPETVKWLKATATKDGFILTADPNASIDARTAKVSYAVSSKSGSFEVKQLGEDPYLDTDIADIDASYEGGSYDFTYKTNSTLSATCTADWVTLTVADGKISVAVEMNYEMEERNTTVSYKVAKSDIAGSIAISQEAAPAVTKTLEVLDADQNPAADIDVPSSASDASIIVKSNASWTAVSSADWVTLAPASKEINQNRPVSETVAIKVAANTAATERTATITVTAPDVEEGTVEITVTQAPYYNIDIEITDIESDAATANYTPSGEFIYLADLFTKEDWETDTPEGNAEYLISYYEYLGSQYNMDLADVISILGHNGAASDNFDELDPETEYVSFAFVVDEEGNILSDVFYESFATTKENFVYRGESTWNDCFVADLYGMEGETTWTVSVYERADKPGLFKIYPPYGALGLSKLTGMSLAEAQGYTGNWKENGVKIDATDPAKVVFPYQNLGILLNSTEGWAEGGSQYQGQNGLVNMSYGKYENGKITFPTKGLIVGLSELTNLWYANSSGPWEIVIPAAGTSSVAPKAAAKTRLSKNSSKIHSNVERVFKTMKVTYPYKRSAQKLSK